MSKKEIAVRLYQNPKFGTTYGKGKFHSAVFNASAEVLPNNGKYLLDFYSYEKFEHIATRDDQMDVLEALADTPKENSLFSWVVSYNPSTKSKAHVCGFSTYDTAKGELVLVLPDDDQSWKLPVRTCRASDGKNSPTLLATNAEDLNRR